MYPLVARHARRRARRDSRATGATLTCQRVRRSPSVFKICGPPKRSAEAAHPAPRYRWLPIPCYAHRVRLSTLPASPAVLLPPPVGVAVIAPLSFAAANRIVRACAIVDARPTLATVYGPNGHSTAGHRTASCPAKAAIAAASASPAAPLAIVVIVQALAAPTHGVGASTRPQLVRERAKGTAVQISRVAHARVGVRCGSFNARRGARRHLVIARRVTHGCHAAPMIVHLRIRRGHTQRGATDSKSHRARAPPMAPTAMAIAAIPIAIRSNDADATCSTTKVVAIAATS